MEKIGRHVYRQLKSLPDLTDEQKAQMDEYEKKINPYEDRSERLIEYSESLKSVNAPDIPLPDKYQVWKTFQHIYEQNEGCEYVSNADQIHNIAALVYYFLGDEKALSYLDLISKPDFSKGIALIGGYGSGKTSTMEALRQAIISYPDLRFRSVSASGLVLDFESCHEPEEKAGFWKRVSAGNLYIDDVKKERQASNYGKVNLMKDVLEARYRSGLTTHMSCNWKEGHEGDIQAAMDEFGEKYGGHVHDRIFQMCNVLVWRGKSMRK